MRPTQRLISESLRRLGSIFLANDSFVFPNRVTQREPGMADGHNRGRSSQREFAFRSQGLALVEVCLALFERDHGLPPKILEPARRQLGVSHRVLDVAVAEVSLQRPGIVALVGQRKTTGVAQHVRMSRKA